MRSASSLRSSMANTVRPGREGGALDGHAAAARSDVPQHAASGRASLPRATARTLGLGDHPVAVAIGIVGKAPGQGVGPSRTAPPQPASGSPPGPKQDDDGQRVECPAGELGESTTRSPTRRPCPSRLHTATTSTAAAGVDQGLADRLRGSSPATSAPPPCRGRGRRRWRRPAAGRGPRRRRRRPRAARAGRRPVETDDGAGHDDRSWSGRATRRSARTMPKNPGSPEASTHTGMPVAGGARRSRAARVVGVAAGDLERLGHARLPRRVANARQAPGAGVPRRPHGHCPARPRASGLERRAGRRRRRRR